MNLEKTIQRLPFLMMVAMSKLWNTQFLSFCDVILGVPGFDIHNRTS